MAASGIFQTRKRRTHRYFTSQKNAWRIIVFTGARKPENQLSLALFPGFPGFPGHKLGKSKVIIAWSKAMMMPRDLQLQRFFFFLNTWKLHFKTP